MSVGSYAFKGCDLLTSITFKDPTTWYISVTNRQKIIDVSDAVTNVTYLTSTYYDHYWYKI